MKPIQLDTSLTEFTYTVAREATTPMKRRLPEKLFRAINTEKGAMRFAARSSFEEKREFFSYLGIEHYSIFVDLKKADVNDFRSVFNQFDIEDKPTAVLKKLADANVYISSNKEMAYLLGFLAQTVDTKSYVQNMELVRTGYHIKKFKNKINIPEYSEANETKGLGTEVIKIINSVLWANDVCEQITGVDQPSLRLLLYFYINRGAHLDQEKLVIAFAGALSGRTITASRKKLSSKSYISRSPIQERNEYTITGKGILVVNQFRERVIKSLDF